MRVICGATFVVLLICHSAFGCPKVPQGQTRSSRTHGDNGYRLVFSDEQNGYEPGKIYNILLHGSRTHSRIQHFTHFILTAQISNGPTRNKISRAPASPKRVGRFQLFNDALTKFHDSCVNTVTQTDDLPKTEIQAMWVAPAAGSGCIALSAMVFENRNSWFSDDGELTKIVCELPPAKPAADECCACDEAKYNFVFEGIWSKETHPKNYPFAVWLTHFSDVIGASHDSNFTFWGENHIATDGFRSLAEWGSVRAMEIELRSKGPRLRTLIKAAGLWYPDVNSNTSSTFKVDRKHHKVSLASMFGPSPDWVVGISGENLCLPDCTWKESLDFDLYPWDAGTDDGISYMSPNAETQPRERMFKITTMYPEDPRAPFYDPTSTQMNPLAKLYIRREKVIKKNCDDVFLQSQLDVSENEEEDATAIRPECDVTSYTQWTPCSVTCGKGISSRTRQYKNPDRAAAAQCKRQLISKEMCVAAVAECENGNDSEEDDGENLAQSEANVNDRGEGVGVCRTSVWSDWSPCSATCGIGISMRTRTFIDYAGRKKCPHVSVVEKQKCMEPECVITDLESPDPNCPVTGWSDWSPCSTTCGAGVVIRTRLLLLSDPGQMAECAKKMDLNQQKPCSNRADCVVDENAIKAMCQEKPSYGQCRASFQRFAYNPETQSCQSFAYSGCRGNGNNFLSFDECMQTCHSRPTTSVRPEVPSVPAVLDTSTQCIMSEWGEWSRCSVVCGNGFTERHRQIVQPSSTGTCNRKVVMKKRCSMPPC